VVASVVRVGPHEIGVGHPCFVIAEVGVNHNGDISVAERLIDEAAEIGADAVKFQTFTPELLATSDAPKARYQSERDDAPTQAEMLRRLALDEAAHVALKARAEARNLVFLSSAFDADAVEFLDSLDVAAIKVPSGELTNHALLAQIARTGRPVLMSTGMATMPEVDAAMEPFQEMGASVVLLHCVSSYPAPPAEANLRAMNTLRERFAVPVGWSDHTPGIAIAGAAVALGANVVEKHLTLDRSMPGPDHAASLEPDEFRSMVDAVRNIESAIGDGVKVPTAAEADIARVARKSLHWRRTLSAGDRISADDLIALRPGTGLPPSELDRLVGRAVTTPTAAGTLVTRDQLEPVP
jgi:N-acetylneuraminate synthase/N,N'-diacetyllegionaminate synthase